jgi:hypothetical protein
VEASIGNGLIAAEDSSRLERWIEQISYTMFNLLEGAVEEAFAAYDAESEGRSG